MRIKWRNIVFLILLLVSATLIVHSGESILGFFGKIKSLAPSGDQDDRVMGLIALGLVGIVIVAVVRLLRYRHSDNGPNR